MSKSLAMQFGSSGMVSNLPDNIRLIDSGEVTDGTTVTLETEPGGQYALCVNEFNASSGAYRGHRIIVIASPEEDVFGSTACAHGTAYASSNAGVSTGYPNDSTITLQRSSATYAFRYAFYKLF